jgi:hypothetical protein
MAPPINAADFFANNIKIVEIERLINYYFNIHLIITECKTLNFLSTILCAHNTVGH